jgi:hypothetical protein
VLGSSFELNAQWHLERHDCAKRETTPGAAAGGTGSASARAMRLRRLRVVVAVLALSACNPFSAAERNRWAGDPYALDEFPRNASPDERVECHPELLVSYGGAQVKLEPPARIAEPFRERLQRFERVVSEIGIAVYGRAPSRILHAGTYACRQIAHRQERLSEHALGNAIDVTGFRFPALAEPTATFELPSRLRAPFAVTVARDWNGKEREGEAARRHRQFFEALARTLRERPLFRSAIGPADPNHQTHLHLDMAPWSYVRL